MNPIRYGFFGEDEAQRLFLHNYLLQLPALIGKPEINFTPDYDFHGQVRAVNKQQVDALFADAATKGFLNFNLHLFIVGRDCDHYNHTDCTKLRKQMETQIEARWRDRTIIFVPVQCIEHWLWYLMWYLKNPGNTKNISFEAKSNADAKMAVYSRKRSTWKHSEPIVEGLTKRMDIAWLCSRSQSFLAFHRKTVDSVNKLPI